MSAAASVPNLERRMVRRAVNTESAYCPALRAFSSPLAPSYWCLTSFSVLRTGIPILCCFWGAILVGGRVVHQGTIEDLTARTRYYEIRLAGEPTPDMARCVREALGCGPEIPNEPAQRGTLPTGETFEQVGGTLRLNISEAQSIQPIIDALRRHAW